MFLKERKTALVISVALNNPKVNETLGHCASDSVVEHTFGTHDLSHLDPINSILISAATP